MSERAIRPWVASAERSPALDGLRGVAILLVMLYHLTLYSYAKTPLERALTVLPSIGWSGVDLFFVLSGFLITGILLRTRHGDGYFRSFYARRVLRIFPLYYAVLAFFLLIIPRFDVLEGVNFFWWPGADSEGAWYWLYLSNVKVSLTGRFHHMALQITWSLAIEEHFYLLWPVVVYLSSPRRLLQICVGAIAGALALRVALLYAGADSMVLYTLTPCRIDTLATGALIAVLASDARQLARLARFAKVCLPISAALVVAYLALRPAAVARIVPTGGADAVAAASLEALGSVPAPWLQTIGYTALCVLYGALLVSVLTAPPRGLRERIFSWLPLRRIGKHSYAMYLLHLVAAEVTRWFFEPGRYPDAFIPAQLFFWVLAMGVTYVMALGTWHGLEVHFLRLKRYAPYPTAPTRAAEAAPRAVTG